MVNARPGWDADLNAYGCPLGASPLARTIEHGSPHNGPELAGALRQGNVAVLQRIRTVRDNCHALPGRTQTAACTHAVILCANRPPHSPSAPDRGAARRGAASI